MIVMPGAWRCERHRLWTNGDCPDCDADLIAAHEERQDEDMSAPLTTRDALAEALTRAAHAYSCGGGPIDPHCLGEGVYLADALLASGALTDATKLAEDEAVMGGWERGVRGAVADAMIEHGPDGHVDGYEEIAAAAMRALAAALSAQSERAEVER